MLRERYKEESAAFENGNLFQMLILYSLLMTFPYLSKAVARKPLHVCVCQKLGADATALFRLVG